MSKIITICTDNLLFVVEQKYRRGEISLEQYAECLRRSKNIEQEARNDLSAIKAMRRIRQYSGEGLKGKNLFDYLGIEVSN